MSRFRTFHKYRLRFGLLAALLATIIAGLFAVARGQEQDPTNCQVFGSVRVCAGEFLPVAKATIGVTGPIITLGREDKPQTVRVFRSTLDESQEGGAVMIIPLDNLKNATLIGDLTLASDPLNQPLVRTRGDLSRDQAHMIVDMNEARIHNATEKFPSESIRNAGLGFDFLKASAMPGVFALASREELSDVDIGFDLRTGRFDALVPLSDQRLLFGRDVFRKSPELSVRVSLDNKADGETTIQAFRAEVFGFNGEFKGAKIIRSPIGDGPRAQGALAAADDKPVELEIETLSFSRADNPDLPNLDASQPDLVFSIQGVQYKDGRFSVRGGAVGLPDWQVSRAFKLTNQRVSIVTDANRTSSTLIVSSTLSFPSGSVAGDARTFPLAMRFAARELPDGKVTTAMTGTLLTAARPALDLGPLTISTPAKTELVFDPASNFFGLKADQVTVRWDSGLGGGSGVQSGLKLGIDKSKNLVFGLGAGGGITLPAMRSQALTLQVSGAIANTADLTTFTLTGKAQLTLPGNGGVSPNVSMVIRSGKDVFDVAVCPPKIRCLKRFEWKLDSFALKVAGFGLGIGNAQGTGDGGFQVGTASLTVPLGIKSIAGSVNGLKVAGNGDISITGGSVELPPMQVGSFSLVGVKGSFVKNTTGYEFKGAGTIPLPGLEPNSGKKLSGEVIIRTRFDGSFQGFGVSVQFDTGSPGIPIANTGMELTMLRGSFDVNSSTLKIAVGMRASTQIRFGPVPAATAEGTAQLQINPFQFIANAKLSVLVLQVAEASIGVGHQQGFNGGPGFNVAFSVNFILTHGETKLRVGPVTLSNGTRKTVIAAEALYTVGIKRSAIFPLMPPANVSVAQLAFKGGTFLVRGGSETLGLLGKVRVPMPLFIPDVSLSIFVDLQSKKVDVTDTDDYTLIGATALRAQAARGVAGYSSRSLSVDEAQALSLLPAQAALQETLPVTLDRSGMALFGISYPAGPAPTVRLRLPDGTVLTEQGVAKETSAFLRHTEGVTEPHELAFVLANAQPGEYSLIVDGAPAAYDTISYMLNDEPVVSDVAVSCGGAPIAGVSVECAGTPGGGEATVTWAMQDTDSPTATVTIGYAPLLLGVDGPSADLSQLTPLAEGLPQGQGSFTWQLGDVPTGSYALVVRASDGQNAPVELAATAAIGVVDQRAPAAPANLKAEPLPGELLLRWQPNTEPDLAGYEIGFGLAQPGTADDPANFVYQRDMGAKETSAEASDLYDAKLWGLEDDREVFVGLRAYDRSGNASEWTLLRAKPWALSPEAWTPVPDGALAMTGAVEVAFASPLGLDVEQPLPGELLTLLRADGTAVAGRLEALLNLEGDAAVGLRFVPQAALRGGERYTAVVKGGAGGISSADGRQMAQDYRWSFVAENQSVFLPLVGR